MHPLFNIVLVRVDNRLVHGQLIEAWVPYLQAACVIVVDDEVASDFFRETVIKMAVPKEVEVIIMGVEEFAKSITFSQGRGKNTIVLFCHIANAMQAYKFGFNFNKLNIGNVYSDNCTLCCSRSVFLGESDINDIIALMYERGIQVELRGVPRDEPVDFQEIIAASNRH